MFPAGPVERLERAIQSFPGPDLAEVDGAHGRSAGSRNLDDRLPEEARQSCPGSRLDQHSCARHGVAANERDLGRAPPHRAGTEARMPRGDPDEAECLVDLVAESNSGCRTFARDFLQQPLDDRPPPRVPSVIWEDSLQHNTQRIEIRTTVDDPPFQQLRGRVGRRPTTVVDVGGAEQIDREAEVEQPDVRLFPGAREEDVLRLEIGVQPPRSVDFREGLADRPCEQRRVLRGELRRRLAQRPSLEALDDEGPFLGAPRDQIDECRGDTVRERQEAARLAKGKGQGCGLQDDFAVGPRISSVSDDVTVPRVQSPADDVPYFKHSS